MRGDGTEEGEEGKGEGGEEEGGEGEILAEGKKISQRQS